MASQAARRVPDLLNVSRESLAKLEEYLDVLLAWQARTNLIGPETVTNIWERHVVDSLQLLPLLPSAPTLIADLGSGAGFPGLVLAIAGGHCVHLYESVAKKSAFLREVIRRVRCNAVVHNIRIETLAGLADSPPFQIVTARAFAPLPKLLKLAEPLLQKGATGLFHKGQDVDAELTEATKYWKIAYKRHRSMTDPNSVLLEVLEASRV